MRVPPRNVVINATRMVSPPNTNTDTKYETNCKIKCLYETAYLDVRIIYLNICMLMYILRKGYCKSTRINKKTIKPFFH